MRPRALTEFQIIKLSHRMTNVDWDSLAGLMDIPYEERETIKMDSNFPDPSSKAKRMLSMINEKCDSNRNLLKCLDKMERADFKEIMKVNVLLYARACVLFYFFYSLQMYFFYDLGK